MEVANLNLVEIAANIPAEYLGRVRAGLKAAVTSDSYATRTFPGTLIAIAPAIANAVFQATGTRIREMPIRLPEAG